MSMNRESKSTKPNLAAALRAHYKTQFKHVEASVINHHTLPMMDVQLSLVTAQREKKRETTLGSKERKNDDRADTKSNTSEAKSSLQELRPEENSLHYYETWYNQTTTVNVKDIFEEKESKPVKRALVIGPAGIGKTTLMRYIAHQWGCSQLWDNYFEYVFCLPLRKLHTYKNLAEAIHAICLNNHSSYTPMQIGALLDDPNARILLLLDGYDEIAASLTEDAPITLVFNQALQSPQTVLLTSRPYQFDGALLHFDRHLENRGFSNEQIKNYIAHYFNAIGQPTLAGSLAKWLETSPHLWGMAHVPINLSLLCGLWEEQASLAAEEPKETPASLSPTTETITQLYQKMVTHLLKRYLLEKKKHNKVEVRSLSVEGVQVACQNELAFLSTLAFNSLKVQQIQLSPQLIKETLKTFSNHLFVDAVLQTGLLQMSIQNTRAEIDNPHHFIHLSFQEYFAAYYLWQSLRLPLQHPSHQAAYDFVRLNKYQPRYALLLRFVVGLTHLDKKDHALLSFWKALLNEPVNLTGLQHLNIILPCLEEADYDKRIPHQDFWLAALQTHFDVLCRHMLLSTDKSLRNTSRFIFWRYFPVLGKNASPLPVKFIVLEKALEDKDCDVRYMAAWTLGRLGEKAATLTVIDALSKALEDKEDYIRCEAAEALGHLAEKAAIPTILTALAKVFEDEESRVRQVAIEILGRLGEKAATPPVLAALAKALRDESYDVRHAAAKILGRLTEEAVTPVFDILFEALENENDNVRDAAIEILSQLGEKAAIPAILDTLLTALENENDDVRNAAIKVLSQLGEKAATPTVVNTLFEALENEEDNIRDAAIEILGHLGEKVATPTVVGALFKALKGKKDDARHAATNALGQLAEEAATPAVVHVLLRALEYKKKGRKIRSSKSPRSTG